MKIPRTGTVLVALMLLLLPASALPGGKCYSDSECAGGKCRNNKCTTAGGKCYSDSECAGGKCRNNKCTTAGGKCYSDSDCPGGKCRNNKCTNSL